MAVIDPAFEHLLEMADPKRAVWRIMQMELVIVPKSDWGKFYSGDCYLLYDSDKEEHVYFWIGKECSVDEQAVAAIKAVELDNLFGGLPVQHREAQGYESEGFKNLFESGMVVKLGGTETALKKVEEEGEEAQLYRIRGGMRPVLTQVPMAWSSMNHGDTFVLDSGKKIFVWAGSGSSGQERMKAGQVAAKLRDEVGEEIVHVTDGNEEEEVDEEWTEHLPLEGRGDILDKDPEEDRAVATNLRKEIALYRVSDATGSTLVKEGQLTKDDLEDTDAFLINGGVLGIWVWIGRGSSKEERKAVMALGEKYIKEENLPPHTPLTRVVQGGETEEFKTLFAQW